ncbi:sigma-70 family RNA polymerase sigma factor [Winogradskyella sp. F6397]|uniref:Sigma-70 family RNA polymerase sigma factor n=1 Tax=Winogradskyella marina TaxID=2785530 RepID=A0ABS0EIF3_9FLAO|nr:sigma-70 family RNA polymerase sigma factor [Winogradskyella marina]MBF8149265.1 sigma-70 family RNA polymerase sigma factor [Winogradskyella marina]
MSDQELIQLIRDDQDYLGVVYKNCKDYCMSFMRKMTNNYTNNDLSDIYQDAIIILYEKIVAGNFELTATIQTYLNSVCRFQLLTKFKSDKKTIKQDDEIIFDLLNKNEQFDDTITDILEPIENEKENQFNAIENALKMMKDKGGKCYELLTLFWYQRKSMKYISEYLGYTNAANAKAQKYKCQKRLEKFAFNYLNL